MNTSWIYAAGLLLGFLVISTSAQFTATSTNARQTESYHTHNYRQNGRQFEALPETRMPPKPAASVDNDRSDQQSQQSHSRSKRMIWITDDGRLALPPGTVLSIAPTISLPLVRYPPSGFLSNLTMSFPLTIDFDKLGLTDNENPLGVLPPVFGRSMGRAAGSMFSHYVSKYLHFRRKRDTSDATADAPEERGPELPEEHRHVFHGGERAILYGVVEDMIATFGLNGKACMLRAICEMHSKAVHQYGLFGEMAKLFFTASKSKYSEMLPEYVMAEKTGEGSTGPGECFPYFKDCPRGLFRTQSSTMTSTPPDEATAHSSDDLDVEHVSHLQDNEISEINGMDDRYSM